MYFVRVLFASNPVGLLLEDNIPDTIRLFAPRLPHGALISLDIQDA